MKNDLFRFSFCFFYDIFEHKNHLDIQKNKGVRKMNRSYLEICVKILEVAKKGAKKSHIVFRANLNFHMVENYLTQLISRKFLHQDYNLYFTTEKGRDYVKQFTNFIDNFEIDRDSFQPIKVSPY